jgi:7-keto-8-aminopelargonate synthetase-like enzyme
LFLLKKAFHWTFTKPDPAITATATSTSTKQTTQTKKTKNSVEDNLKQFRQQSNPDKIDYLKEFREYKI